MIEEVDHSEPFATFTVEVYDDPDTDSHIPMFRMDFLEGYPIEPVHVLSLRDSIALGLYKVDTMIERADSLVILDDE
jgi:hypothetical protein